MQKCSRCLRALDNHLLTCQFSEHLNRQHNLLFCSICWICLDSASRWFAHLRTHDDAQIPLQRPWNFSTHWPNPFDDGQQLRMQLYAELMTFGRRIGSEQEVMRWYAMFLLLYPENTAMRPYPCEHIHFKQNKLLIIAQTSSRTTSRHVDDLTNATHIDL